MMVKKRERYSEWKTQGKRQTDSGILSGLDDQLCSTHHVAECSTVHSHHSSCLSKDSCLLLHREARSIEHHQLGVVCCGGDGEQIDQGALGLQLSHRGACARQIHH